MGSFFNVANKISITECGKKTALLKRYYTELDAKYYGKEPAKLYSLLSEQCFIFCWLTVTVFACRVLVIFCLYILLQI